MLTASGSATFGSIGTRVVSGGGGGGATDPLRSGSAVQGGGRRPRIVGGGGGIERGLAVWSQRRGFGVISERIEAFGGLTAQALEVLP